MRGFTCDEWQPNKNINMKTFVVKILTSEGLEHHQLIADEDDVTILMEVIKKIERRANKLKAEAQEEASKISSNAVLSNSLQQDTEMLFHECPKCNCRCNCSAQPCSCCNV